LAAGTVLSTGGVNASVPGGRPTGAMVLSRSGRAWSEKFTPMLIKVMKVKIPVFIQPPQAIKVFSLSSVLPCSPIEVAGKKHAVLSLFDYHFYFRHNPAFRIYATLNNHAVC
jgi:hypothetical protein